MLILLSPAKTLNQPTQVPRSTAKRSTPVFLEHAKAFATAMSAWDLNDAMANLKLSESMGLRAMKWHEDWQEKEDTLLVGLFGDAFKSLDLASF